MGTPAVSCAFTLYIVHVRTHTVICMCTCVVCQSHRFEVSCAYAPTINVASRVDLAVGKLPEMSSALDMALFTRLGYISLADNRATQFKVLYKLLLCS